MSKNIISKTEKNKEIDIYQINSPIELLNQLIGHKIYIKCKNDRELTGYLHAYDVHLNLMLSKVTEININEESCENNKRSMDVIFIRGDLIILVSPID